MTESAGAVTVRWLAMSAPDDHQPGRPLPSDVLVRQVAASDCAPLASELYRRVGTPWQWTDRQHWTVDEWRAAVDRPGVELWTLSVGGSLAGYFQLHASDDDVEIKYFGLLPEWIGRGLGGGLLSRAVDRAWELTPVRVTLNTCSLDHPAALANYLARGFRVIRSAARDEGA
ncbi:MAG TPA: GNAT family N-acetyltransferase [Gemmatimonadales bacterium]